MLILWRTLLIVLCCLIVMICYPYYADGAMVMMLAWTVATFAVMATLTVITQTVFLGQSRIFNILFDIVLVIVFMYILLNIFLQLDGKTPYMHIKKGVYPTAQEIEVGLENVGLSQKKKTFRKLQNNVDKFTEGFNQINPLITREHKD